MKAPKNCPVCGDPMLNTFPPAEDLSDRVTKQCNKRLSHSLTITCDGDVVASISIRLDSAGRREANWYFYINELWIADGGKDAVALPFFEPNLSNYKKLVDKVKTYLVFS